MKKQLTIKGVVFNYLSNLKQIRQGEIITPIKYGNRINKILYTDVNGIAWFVPCKTNMITFEGGKMALIMTAHGATFRALENCNIFLSSCGGLGLIY